MKLISISYSTSLPARAALFDDGLVIDLRHLLQEPITMRDLLRHPRNAPAEGRFPLEWLGEAWEAERERAIQHGIPVDNVFLAAPLPDPASVRDFYAFEEHVRAARGRRGLEVIPEWYRAPIFYFSNHQAIYGPNDPIRRPRRSAWLDYELEVAAIIGRKGRDIPAEAAEQYVAGYTIMNDWSARDVQRQEMKVGLGPAKGKDFATSLGPWLVTPDELADRRSGKGYDLEMIARRNGVELSRGNWRSIHFSFGEMIARASEDTTLYPGDVIGSGTVGSGCILELGEERAGGWLQPGDIVELEVERHGTLRNEIV